MTGLRSAAVALLGLLVLVGAASAQTAPTGTDPMAAQRLLAAVNDIRAKSGLAPLTLDPALSRAAQAFAEDLARRRIADTVDASGAGVDQRFRRVGYAYSLALENVAAGIETPVGVVNYWMSRPTDRFNLLASGARDAGIGFVFRPDDKPGFGYSYYWVLDIGTRLERQIGN